MIPLPASLAQIAAWMQILPFFHIVIACVTTSVIIKKRRSVSMAVVILSVIVTWMIPILGPLSVLWAFRNTRSDL
jgi:hypothetical protein